jgi:ATP synthase F0 subunit b
MFIVNLFPQLRASLLLFAWAEGTNPLIPKTFNLLLFLAVMIYILRRPFSQAMQDRRDAIQNELKRAKAEKAAAEEKLREIEARLNRLNEEVNEIRLTAEREAKAEFERLVKQAEEEAERLKVTAQREIEGAAKAAQMQLREYAAAKSVELAETIIRREMKPDDNARLIGNFAKELERVK